MLKWKKIVNIVLCKTFLTATDISTKFAYYRQRDCSASYVKSHHDVSKCPPSAADSCLLANSLLRWVHIPRGRSSPVTQLWDDILLKKNLVDPAEHDGKDPDVIPPQNSYCAEMEQPGGIPNMLLPPNDYIGPEDRANYRIEAVQEMPFDPVPQKSALYETGYTGSLQRNPKVRKILDNFRKISP
ncbi:hypothetical protein AVEN_251460-1 [Araneus ventricosus]|uniref:Uncharacterized protein n=1 Tax=Araneus ventricosus TaxID=182803 RepID=A0A4Y2NEX0_ARAVE|nr:hypothetical protein AVEN_251460-1 [Araneus ventricosus]